MSTALTIVPTSNFLVMQGDTLQRLPDLIRENLGNLTLREYDLPTAKVPSGGGNAWQVPGFGDEADSVKELVGVIVYAGDRRTYFSKGIDEGPSGPPDCSSPDGVRGYGVMGDMPDVNHDCSRCPMAKWKSAHGGEGAGQACSQQKLIAILREGDSIPLMVRLPPTSVKAINKYLLALVARLGKGYWEVLTRATLKSEKGDSGPYSVAVFEPAGILSREDADKVKPLKLVMAQTLGSAPGAKPTQSVDATQPAAAGSDPSSLK